MLFHLRVHMPPPFWGYRLPLGEHELLTLPEHLSSLLVFTGVRATRSLVLCVRFVDRCLSVGYFSFGHCVVCPSIYGFWLPPFGIFKLFSLYHDNSKIKTDDWLAQNLNNVSEWGDMSIRILLFQWTRIQLSALA
jgi:hypothetical protein